MRGEMEPTGATRPGYRELAAAIAAARQRTFQRVLRHGLVRTLGIVAAALAFAVAAIMIWPRSWAAPLGAITFFALLVTTLGRRLILPLRRVPDVAHYARKLDEMYSRAGEPNEFLSALELGGAPAAAGTSSDLVAALVAERVRAAERLDLDAPGRAELSRRWVALMSAGVACLALALAVSPARFAGALAELVHPRWPGLSPVTIDVLTGDLRVDQGVDVAIEARVTGATARPALHARRGAGVWRHFTGETISGAASAAPVYRFVVPAVEAETRYRVAAGSATSPEYVIRVREPLRITSFQLEYRYPDYAGLDSETIQAADGAVSALRGTEVQVTFETNQPLRGGVVDVAGGTRSSITLVDANRGRAVIPVKSETTYTLILERERRDEGDQGKNAFGPYRITPAPDREPMVAILEPGADSDVPAELRQPLVIHAADDYGLSNLTLHFSYEGDEPAAVRLRRFTGYPREATESHLWDLSGLNLVPGDVIRYYVEVFDNDTVSGPKSARSRTYTLRIPTLTELYAEVGEEHEQAATDLEEMRQEGADLKKELERIAREMTKFPETDWEDRQEVARAYERQAELRQEIEKLAQDLGQALERLENQNLVDDEVLAKVAEIQRLMDQIADPELRDAFKRLSEQLANMDQNEVQRALNELTLSHEELLQNLERTLEMLKQVQLEEKLERAVQQAEEMAERQDQINQDLDEMARDEGAKDKREDAAEKDAKGDDRKGDDSKASDKEASDKNTDDAKGKDTKGKDAKSEAAKGEDAKQEGDRAGEPESGDQRDELSRLGDELDEAAQDQALNLEEAEELEKLLEELAKELAEMNEQMAQEMTELSQESSEQGSMQSSMQSAMQQMGKQDPKSAKKSGQQASRDARSLLERLRMQQQMMMNQQMAEAAEKLREAARELLKVSTSEEELILGAGPEPREMADHQQRLLEATRRVNEVVAEIARSSVMVGTDFAGLLGQPIQSMANAVSSYERGSVASGRTHSTQALAQVNQAILELLATEQSMCQGGGGSCSSMKQSMQRMMGLSQQQQQVNDGTRQLMQQGGSRLSEGSQARLARLAAQQAAIQQGLDEVAQSLEGRRDVLGRLGDVSKDMEEVAENLERGEVDDRLISKQHQIMSRLLDAQHSVRKRDMGQERLSRPGEEMPGPEVLPAVPEDLLTRRERLEADILRGRSDVYPPGFRELVERYFRALIEARADAEGEPATAPN